MKSTNPCTGEVIKTFEPHDQADIDSILKKSVLAYEKNKKRSLKQRIAIMQKVAIHLRENKENLAKIAVMEMGKLYAAAQAEVEKCASLCDYYCDQAPAILSDKVIEGEAQKSYVRYLPIGPVLAVMPWNFPYWQVFRFAVPALLSGNVALLKHASNVSGCALAIEDLFISCGFEEGAFQTLLIGSDKVESVIADDRTKAVTLTGSEGAGRAVASAAGKHLKKTVLELGGSDPFIVMPSADIEKALDAAVQARVQNNGQTCIAAKRYIVHEDIYEEFKNGLIGRYQDLVVGDPMKRNTDVGPLATSAILGELDKQVQKTIAMGATCLCGASVMEGHGNFYQPGLLDNVPEGSPAYGEELFGPVGCLFKVSSIGQAVDLANNTRFGLGSSIFTSDQEEANFAVQNIEAGATFVNSIVASDPRMPFGGVKSSGYGRELAAEGMLEFTNIKTVVIYDLD